MKNRSEWTPIAAQEDIPPNTMRCFTIGSKRILVAFSEGKYFASDEMCTREDASLCTGSLKGQYIKCPLHGSRFDLITGEALDEPASEALRIYGIKVENGQLFVKLDPAGPNQQD